MNRILWSLSLCIGMVLTSRAQQLNKEKLDSYLEALADNDKFMGTVAIARGGAVIYTKASGFADMETAQKPNADTKYRVGSISKTFTATLVFKAVEEGKLRLDESLSAYFKSFEHGDDITLGNLLNHRSGIHNFTNDKAYLDYYTQPISEEKLVEYIRKGGSDFTPNTKADYSNSNYVLLSLILQKVYKKNYAELLKEKIVTPLNLSNTGFGVPIDPEQNVAYSYNYSEGWEKEAETDMSVPIGAGSVVSTPTDLCLFAHALFSGKIIDQKYVNQMMTLKENYGMGLFAMPFDQKTSYGHTGAIDGFSSVFGYFPEEDLAFAVISNGNNYNQNNVNIAVLSAAFNVPYEIPSFTRVEVSAETLEQYTGTYASKALPIKIMVRVKGAQLQAQATGQSAFLLEATAQDVFSFDPAGVVLEFDPEASTMTLKQGGGTYVMTRE